MNGGINAVSLCCAGDAWDRGFTSDACLPGLASRTALRMGIGSQCGGQQSQVLCAALPPTGRHPSAIVDAAVWLKDVPVGFVTLWFVFVFPLECPHGDFQCCTSGSARGKLTVLSQHTEGERGLVVVLVIRVQGAPMRLRALNRWTRPAAAEVAEKAWE
jgi:hypothetical protein